MTRDEREGVTYVFGDDCLSSKEEATKRDPSDSGGCVISRWELRSGEKRIRVDE